MTDRITLQTGSNTSPFVLESEYNGPEPNPDAFGWHSPPMSMIMMFDESATSIHRTKSNFNLETSKNNFTITEKEVK